MSSYIVILTTILLAAITFYLIWYVINRSKPTIADLATTPISVSQVTQLLDSSKTPQQLLSSSGSSVMGFFNLQLADKTVKLNNTYYQLIGIPGAWVFEIAPSPSHNSINTTTARLLVYTTTPDGIKEETIELPDVPLQKWVFLSILRDGRRFDIMYDDDIVASHRIPYYPAITPSHLQVGNVNLVGYCTHVLVSSSRLSSSEVAENRSTLADTNGVPKPSFSELLFPGLSTVNLGSINLSQLNITPSITEPPSNTMKQWATPYA